MSRVGNATVRISEEALVDLEDFAHLRGMSHRQLLDEIVRKYISEPHADALAEYRQLRAEIVSRPLGAVTPT